MKNGKELKGVVVEKHADRIILSTGKGEIPLLLTGIKSIKYDDPEQSFLQTASAYEKAGDMGEALAYYEKALEINPNLEEARKAIPGLRNRLLAVSTEGPRDEVEKQQVIQDSWEKRKPMDEIMKEQRAQWKTALREGLGIALEKKSDWVRLEYVDPKMSAWTSGLKKNDRLVSVDGHSLRYLNVDVVTKSLLFPRYSEFILEFERVCYLNKDERKMSLKQLGIKLILKYEGIFIQSVERGSLAERSGLKGQDLLVSVDGAVTRYMPIQKAMQLIEGSKEDRIILTVRRTISMARK